MSTATTAKMLAAAFIAVNNDCQSPDDGIGPGTRSRLRRPEEPLYWSGRNQPCPCGSGRKFKKCCLGKPASRPTKLHDATHPRPT